MKRGIKISTMAAGTRMTAGIRRPYHATQPMPDHNLCMLYGPMKDQAESHPEPRHGNSSRNQTSWQRRYRFLEQLDICKKKL